MTQRSVLTVIVLVVIVIGAIWFLSQQDVTDDSDLVPGAGYSISLGEQEPGRQVMIDSVSFEESGGYVAVHERMNDEPGEILGVSSFLPSGETENIIISLDRDLEPAGEYTAMLHTSPTGQDPVLDDGETVTENFSVSGEPGGGDDQATTTATTTDEEQDVDAEEESEPDETDEGVI